MINIVFMMFMNGEVTYTKDVRPIFQNRCAQCHNANWKERNWMDYDTAFKHRHHIKMRVKAGNMPPPGNPITKEEKDLIIKWVDQGGKK